MKKKLLMFSLIFICLFSMLTLSGCLNNNEDPLNNEIVVTFNEFIKENDTTFSIKVANSIENFYFSNYINVSENCTWKLTTDIQGNLEIPSKVSTLEIGDNKYYVLVSDNKGNVKMYSLNIRRRPMYNVDFYSSYSRVASTLVEEESTISPEGIQIPSRIGYEFYSWNFDFTQPIMNDTIINANYNPISYTISIDSKGGFCNTTTLEVKPGDVFELSKPVRNGYLFGGWYCYYNDNSYNSVISINNNTWNYEATIIYASWRPIFDISNNTITGLTSAGKQLTEIEIPSQIDNINITSIQSNAFKDCTKLVKVTIPNSITTIGESAFYSCTSLEEIKLSNVLNKINKNMFYNCKSLNEIIIPESIKMVDTDAFYGCENISIIKYDGNIVNWCAINFINMYSIPTGYSLYRTSVRKFYIKNTNTSYEEILTLQIPEEVSKINNYCFYGFNNIMNINIGSDVTCIGEYAFAYCTQLSSIIIPNTITDIEKYAFSNCSNVEKISIGEQVKNIGKYAFYKCSKVTNICYNAINCSNFTMDSNIFTAVGKNNSNVYFTVGAKVTYIPDYLVYASITLHDNEEPNITHIVFMGDNDITIGLVAFRCKDINSVFKHQNQNFTIKTYDDEFTTYIYSETNPGESDKYWHYVDGVVTIW